MVLLDARRGVLEQSKRHAFISALLGIPHMVVAINKMDLVDYSAGALRASCVRSSRASPTKLRGREVDHLHPDLRAERRQRRRALAGDALVRRDRCCSTTSRGRGRLRPPRREAGALPRAVGDPPRGRRAGDYRGYAGQLASGALRRGDEVAVLPGGGRTRIAAIDTFDGQLEEAMAPMSFTLRLEDELDISRGELICHPDEAPTVARELEADVCWMTDDPLRPGGALPAQAHLAQRTAIVDGIEDLLDAHTLERDRGRRPSWPQRHRPRAAAHERAARVRPLREQPPHGQLHPDRRVEQRHGRRRDDRDRGCLSRGRPPPPTLKLPGRCSRRS